MTTNPVDFDHHQQPSVMVMGVTGCGKTTIGNQIAGRLGVPFADADDFHPRANVDKMASGTPLTDEDRWPWLQACGAWMEKHAATGSVMACSALRVAYRDVIREHVPSVLFVHLDGPEEVIVRRVAARLGHFMPAALVQSQYDTLEPLQPNERGVVVSFDQPVSRIVNQAMSTITSQFEGAEDGTA